MTRFALALLLAGLGAGTAAAGPMTFTYTGSPVNIPDNNSTGVNLTITVPNGTPVLSFTDATLSGLSHSWVGDLIATLTHIPSGRTANLFNRVGRVNVGNGDSTNLGDTYTFTDTASQRLIDVAGPLPGNVVVPGGAYRATTVSDGLVNLNTAFGGLADAGGTWQLNISDNAPQDSGSIGGFSITFESVPPPPIPEPATLAVFGLLAAGGAVGYRRRGR